MPTVLAIDLGGTIGWAMAQPDDRIVSGSQKFALKSSDGAGVRYVRFRNWLNEIKGTQNAIGQVVYEDVKRHVGTTAAHVYGGFLATLQSWCEHHQIPYHGVGVGTIKKHATGKGNADKPMMIAAAKARGFDPVDDNEADALAMLDYELKSAAHEAKPF